MRKVIYKEVKGINKKKKIILIIIPIILLIVIGILFYSSLSNKSDLNATRPPCYKDDSESIIGKSFQALNTPDNKISFDTLAGVRQEILNIDGYDTDIYCIYILTIYSIYYEDIPIAEKALNKYEKLLKDSPNIKQEYFRSIDSLKETLNNKRKSMESIKSNTIYIKDLPN